MFRDFAINIFALTSVIFFFGQATRNNQLSRQSSFQVKTSLGALSGLFGILLMYFSLHVTDTMIVDLRHIPTMLMAVFGGFYPALVAAIITGFGRLLLTGVDATSITALCSMIFLVLVFGVLERLCRDRSPLFKMRVMNLYDMVQVSFIFYYLIPNVEVMRLIVVYYWLFSLIGSEIALRLTLYLRISHEMFRRFRDLASKDFLTGLLNVRQFHSVLSENLQQADERQERVSLLFVDIDHFKHVNDTYGHPAGDEVLKQLGMVMIHAARPIDTVSRNGGEEFSIILGNCPRDYALEIGERVRDAVSRHPFALPDGKVIHVTVSVGVATYPDTASSADDLLQQADEGLYTAKRTGRNKVCAHAVGTPS